MNTLDQLIKSSQFWVNYDSTNVPQIKQPFNLTRTDTPLEVTFTNITDKPIPIYAVVVAEFMIPLDYELKEVLEHGWLQASPTKFKPPSRSTKENKIFMRRDQNHYSFKKLYGHLPNSIVSEWFSVLRFKGTTLVLGAATTSKQYTVIYTAKEKAGYKIRVVCQFDEEVILPGQTLSTEKVWWGYGKEEEQLANYAHGIAENMHITNVKPRVKALCCSYYWNGNYIDEALINKELDTIKEFNPKLNIDYIQLDAGYSNQWGDWLDTNDRFPSGLKNMADKIKNMGYKPGIWLAPFVANPKSKIFKHHPDWFLKNNSNKTFEARFTTPIDRYITPMSYRTLDPTHPEVQMYLTEVFSKFKQWGYTYYKLDFMYPICLFKNYYKNMTRAQALHEGMKTIRNAIGDDAYILTAVSPLSPLVGVVDAARMGVDTLTPFLSFFPWAQRIVNNYMLNQNLKSNLLRKHFNNILWVNDPDVLIFRANTGIEEELLERHRKFAIDNKTNVFIGDSIANLTPEQKQRLYGFINNI